MHIFSTFFCLGKESPKRVKLGSFGFVLAEILNKSKVTTLKCQFNFHGLSSRKAASRIKVFVKSEYADLVTGFSAEEKKNGFSKLVLLKWLKAKKAVEAGDAAAESAVSKRSFKNRLATVFKKLIAGEQGSWNKSGEKFEALTEQLFEVWRDISGTEVDNLNVQLRNYGLKILPSTTSGYSWISVGESHKSLVKGFNKDGIEDNFPQLFFLATLKRRKAAFNESTASVLEIDTDESED